MADFTPVDVRLLVRFEDRQVVVTKLQHNGNQVVQMPAAAAKLRDSNDFFYFKEAIAGKNDNSVSAFEWIEHAFYNPADYDYTTQISLTCFLLQVFAHEDVRSLGTQERFILVCSSYLKQSERMSIYKDLDFRPQPRNVNDHILFTSEERLYAKGSGFSHGIIMNLTSDFNNLVHKISTPVYNQYADSSHVAGPGFDTIVNSFIKMLCMKGHDYTDTKGQAFCRELVLKYCYVPLDLKSEMELLEKKGGVLHVITSPDGTSIELGKECFLAPECLFDPSLVGLTGVGVAGCFHDASERFQEADEIPVLLCGYFIEGLVGYGERLQREVAKTQGGNIKLQLLTASTLEQSVMTLQKSEFINQYF